MQQNTTKQHYPVIVSDCNASDLVGQVLHVKKMFHESTAEWMHSHGDKKHKRRSAQLELALFTQSVALVLTVKLTVADRNGTKIQTHSQPTQASASATYRQGQNRREYLYTPNNSINHSTVIANKTQLILLVQWTQKETVTGGRNRSPRTAL